MRRFDQLLAGYAEGDAISQEARKIRDIARGMGMDSDIYAPSANIGSRVADDCFPVEKYKGSNQDIVLYHFATDSAASGIFRQASSRKLIRYHNITPAHFFDGFMDSTAAQLRRARSSMNSVAECAELIMADSSYNGDEIRELGIDSGKVMDVPLFFDVDDFKIDPSPSTMAKFSGPFKNILFVGRMAPNKCVEDIILAFAWYNRSIETASRLILVGSDRSCPRYFAMLRMFAGRLGLANVAFEGFLSDSELAACYKAADVFVCASRHEGYCLPLIEAMSCNIPVIARNQGGMPQTMDGAGVLFDNLEPKQLAVLIDKVLSDQAFRGEILASQRQRLAKLITRRMEDELKSIIERLS